MVDAPLEFGDVRAGLGQLDAEPGGFGLRPVRGFAGVAEFGGQPGQFGSEFVGERSGGVGEGLGGLAA